MTAKLTIRFLPALAVLATVLFTGRPASAHCDTMSGPVVRAAQLALDRGDVSLALRWVRPQDESEVMQAFDAARRARALKPQNTRTAERRFFEVLVRLHRESEGEPYTGLKETPPDPALVAADKALETGDITPLTHGLASDRADAIRQRFARARQLSGHAGESVAAGREYVRAYVEFIHLVEAEEADATHADSLPH